MIKHHESRTRLDPIDLIVLYFFFVKDFRKFPHISSRHFIAFSTNRSNVHKHGCKPRPVSTQSHSGGHFAASGRSPDRAAQINDTIKFVADKIRPRERERVTFIRESRRRSQREIILVYRFLRGKTLALISRISNARAPLRPTIKLE